MQRHRMPLLVSILLLLAGCAGFVKSDPVVQIPPVPADVQACKTKLSDGPATALNAGETERQWKADRAEAAKVNACLQRLRCQYADVRRNIAKVDDPVCKPRKNR